RDHLRADLEAVGRQDVALLAVGVVEERDSRRAVRVVLDRRDLRRDVHLVAAEVDDPVEPLVAAAHEAAGLPPLVVAASRGAEPHREALLRTGARQLDEVVRRLETASRGCRLELFDRHNCSLHSLEELELLARRQADVRLLPVLALAEEPAHALPLPLAVGDADIGDLDAEELFDGPADLDLVGPAGPLDADRLGRFLQPRWLL